MEREEILSLQKKRDTYAELSRKSYQEYDDCDKAIEYMYLAIDLSKALPFEDNDFLALAYYDLAVSFENNEDINKAREYYDLAIKLFEKTSNVQEAKYLKSVGSIAAFDARDGKYEEATINFYKAITIIESLPKKNKEITELELEFLSNNASCYEILNRHKETLTSCNNVIRCFTGKLDKRTLKKVKLALLLGEFYYQNKGDYSKAADNFEKALFLGEDIFIQNIEQCAIIAFYIGHTSYLAGAYDKAIKYYEDAKKLYIKLDEEPIVDCTINIMLINIIKNPDRDITNDIEEIRQLIYKYYFESFKAEEIKKQIREEVAHIYFESGRIEKARDILKL